MLIEKFVPPEFKKSELNLQKLSDLTGKNWMYAANGASCLFHILKSLNCEGKILLPVFTCSRILIPIQKLGLTPVFYDVDTRDLNSSLASIKRLSEKYDVKTVLSVSLFGNPADMFGIEEYCRSNGLILIDDNAQGLGSTIDGRWLGTFGNGGFFSFFPGKATAGHMGGFFWSDKEYSIKYSRHNIIHWVKWLDYYYNRLNIYEQKNPYFKKIILTLSSISDQYSDLTDDAMAEFENNIMGGILNSILYDDFKFRQQYHDEFLNRFSANSFFKPIQALRGKPNNHKLILLAQSKEIADKLTVFLNNAKIYCSNSYSSLSEDLSELEGMQTIRGRVIELPIENNALKMAYLFESLSKFKC